MRERLPMRGLGTLLRSLLLAAAGVIVALVIGFLAFAGGIVGASPPADPHAEGIVVLTGGSARIDGALRLLADRRASRLLISGVNPAVSPAALAGTIGPDLEAMLACCVDLGHTARDTIGNAAETRAWVEDQGFTSLIVVTSAYHMPRSLAELADAMPKVELIPYPVSNPELHLDDWWKDTGAFALLVREYGKYLLTAARQIFAPTPTAVAGT
ncbi:MAG: YdcF family protein [Bauldia sp.]|nr:YdcF family protein [Bauldia sp.]